MSDTDSLRLLAFYLPQYHPIPENDEWWGKGFTEWTNVAKARPLFPGHYQPHIPADLGFYDLRLAEARQAQAELARAYGISGFVYYHYWFNGKHLLNLPFDQVLASGQPDFPFCLCWANENWTRAWDGRVSEMLLEQTYSPEDDLQHIRWLLRAFEDPRYIRIGGKPLLLIYRAAHLPDARQTVDLWRKEAARAGVELYLCRVESFENERVSPADIGMDAAVEFQPDWMAPLPPNSRPIYGDHRVVDYALFVEHQLEKQEPPYPFFQCVTPSWDNSARRQQRAYILHNSTPSLYGAWLQAVIDCARRKKPEEQLVFINAWNEWAEGNHLEPDLYWGRQYLEATRRALQDSTTSFASLSGDELPIHLREKIARQQDLLALQSEHVGHLNKEYLHVQQAFEAQARWAHELEATVRAQDQTFSRLRRLAGPLAPLARWLLRNKR